MRKLKKQSHFYLGRNGNTARIYLRRTFSNIFITLTDWHHRTIVCKTSGNSGVIGSKRRKKAPYAIENIIKELNVFFKLYKITEVYIILKMRINTFFYFLTKELAFYGINVKHFHVRRPIAFNGTRGRKLRRL